MASALPIGQLVHGSASLAPYVPVKGSYIR